MHTSPHFPCKKRMERKIRPNSHSVAFKFFQALGKPHQFDASRIRCPLPRPRYLSTRLKSHPSGAQPHIGSNGNAGRSKSDWHGFCRGINFAYFPEPIKDLPISDDGPSDRQIPKSLPIYYFTFNTFTKSANLYFSSILIEIIWDSTLPYLLHSLGILYFTTRDNLGFYTSLPSL